LLRFAIADASACWQASVFGKLQFIEKWGTKTMVLAGSIRSRTRRKAKSKTKTKSERFTHLSACLTEEDGGITLHVRLYHDRYPTNAAWGEEITDSIETASALLDEIASTFSIPASRIDISVRMERLADGTRH
jgi:hypothetical protein